MRNTNLPVNDFAIESTSWKDSERIGVIFKAHYNGYNGLNNPAYNGDAIGEPCYYCISKDSMIRYEKYSRSTADISKIYTLAEFEALLAGPVETPINNSYSIY